MVYTVIPRSCTSSASPGCIDKFHLILCGETFQDPKLTHKLEQLRDVLFFLRASMGECLCIPQHLATWLRLVGWDTSGEIVPLPAKRSPHHAWHFSCHCQMLEAALCMGRSVVMCCFDPLTMWTWRMSCACGSASTPQPRTWTINHSLASVISPTNFVEAWWIVWAA